MSSINFYKKILNNTTPRSEGYIDPRRDFKIIINLIPDSNLNKFLRPYADKDELSPFVQTVDIPHINANTGSPADNIIANIETHTTSLNSGNNTLKLSIINTGKPIIESFFYPWLREVTSPIWIYKDRPYTKATITIDFTSHSTVSYKFFGCRPTEIEPLQATHAPNTTLTRNVTITYDLAAVTLNSQNNPVLQHFPINDETSTNDQATTNTPPPKDQATTNTPPPKNQATSSTT